jgi:hypothetical protein
MGLEEEGKMKEIFEGWKGSYFANLGRGNTVDTGREMHKSMQLEEN